MCFIRGVPEEMKTLAKGAEFQYSLTKMMYKLGRARGAVDERFERTLSEPGFEMRAKSEFLVAWVAVVTTGIDWR
jgi:hypothetical protein